MSTYNITHSCGHQAEIRIFGTMADRQRKADFVATQSCSACARQARAVSATAADAEMGAAEVAQALPAMTGSEKQIAWARRLRLEAIEALAALEQAAPFTSQIEELVTRMLARTEAKWWIDHLQHADKITLSAALQA